MQRIAAEVVVHGRTYTLIVTDGPALIELGWYEGKMFVSEPTALEQALGLALEQTRKKLVQVECQRNKKRDCFECPNTQCEHYWGTMFVNQFVAVKEEESMPPKKQVNAAIKKGTNPYAVANAMKKKHGWSAAKTERAVYDITASTLAKGKGKSKPAGKKSGGKKCK